MSRIENALDQMSGRVTDLKSPTHGDERERAVFMESTSFGLTVAMYVCLFGALVASVFGSVLVAVALLVLTVLPAAASYWYARRRGVNLQALSEISGARSTVVNAVVTYGIAALAFAAIAYEAFAGQSLVSPPDWELTPGEGFAGGVVQAGAVGGVIGAFAGVIGSVVAYRKARRTG